METNNSCYTYFKIVGDFNPDYVSELLNMSPQELWKIGDKRRDGTKYDFALWKVGQCNEYDIVVANQMRKTISGLTEKIALLNKIRKENQ